MTTQFPFHPTTGHRLVRTVATAVVFSTARIEQVDGKAIVEVIDTQGINVAHIEQAQIDSAPFVATAGGDTCLLSEAVWSVLDVEHIEGFKADTSGTLLPSLNSALGNLIELGEATQGILDNWQRGDLAGAVNDLEATVLAIPLLRSHLDDEGDD
jgi:hypothetical protein